MSLGRESAYTLLVWLCAFLATAGCGGSASNPETPSADVAEESEIPTVTLPDEHADSSDSSSADGGSTN
jgi:hypothetical protein